MPVETAIRMQYQVDICMVLVVLLYPGPKSGWNNLHVFNIWCGIEGVARRDMGYAVRYSNMVINSIEYIGVVTILSSLTETGRYNIGFRVIALPKQTTKLNSNYHIIAITYLRAPLP